MIIAHCQVCNHAYRLIGKREDMNLFNLPEWAASFPCPTGLCRGRAVRVPVPPKGSRIADVRSQEFYRAIMGQGGAEFERVRETLLTKRVVDIDANPTGTPERTIVHSLTFADGTMMHFGISRMGACAHRLEEPNRALHTDTDPEGSDTDRAQTGRADEDEYDPVDSVRSGFRAASGRPDGDTLEPARSGSVPSVPATEEVPDGDDTRIDQ